MKLCLWNKSIMSHKSRWIFFVRIVKPSVSNVQQIAYANGLHGCWTLVLRQESRDFDNSDDFDHLLEHNCTSSGGFNSRCSSTPVHSQGRTKLARVRIDCCLFLFVSFFFFCFYFLIFPLWNVLIVIRMSIADVFIINRRYRDVVQWLRWSNTHTAQENL